MTTKRTTGWIAALAATVIGTCVAAVVVTGGNVHQATSAYVPPSTIDRSGQTDVTDALNAWLATVPDGSVIDLPGPTSTGPPAVYLLSGTLVIGHRTGLTIDGNGAELKADTGGDVNRSVININSSTDIALEEVTVVGANPVQDQSLNHLHSDLFGQHGVAVHNGLRTTLSHVIVRGTYGDGIYVGGSKVAGTWRPSQQTTITDSSVQWAGRQGISVTDGLDTDIQDTVVQDVANTDLDLEPDSPAWLVDGVNVSQCVFGPAHLTLLSAGGASQVNNVVFDSNQTNGEPLRILVPANKAGQRHNWQITNNVGTKRYGSPTGNAAIHLENLDGVTVVGNQQPYDPTRGDFGVLTIQSCEVDVHGNVFDGAVKEWSNVAEQCG